MSLLNDHRYYERRAEQARANADKATTPTIKQIHLDLAQRYGELAEGGRVRRPRLHLA